MIQHGETSPIYIDVPEQRDGMKNPCLRVARSRMKSRSKTENFVVTEVCFARPDVQSFDEAGRYTVRRRDCFCIALFSIASHSLQCHVGFAKLRDPVGLRGLTVLRFNFKVELGTATEN
jgi:hypothetical protein